ncbi:hypothetical protein [Vibrio owensii]|uniref:hypothetical protein n=1 Tax=Vibrio harveyi group TaxID=717610 RepID=UPI003CC614EF
MKLDQEQKLLKKKIRTLKATVSTFSVKPYKKNMTGLVIELSRVIAAKAFELEDTRRLFTKEPYMTHPERCLLIIEAYDPNMEKYDFMLRSAMLLHDTLEDTFVTKELLTELLMSKLKDIITVDKIVHYVDCLTDKEPHDDRDRLVRKNLEADRFKDIEPKVCDLKLIDSMHNFSNIMLHDWQFAKTYAVEKSYFLKIVEGKTNPQLFQDVKDLLDEFNLYRSLHAQTYGDHAEGYLIWKLTKRAPRTQAMNAMSKLS